jgi:cytochrome c oxidase assembly protein subunit 11
VWPVFFFVDPDFLKDPQVSYVRTIVLGYTFFRTDVDDDIDEEEGEATN